MSPLSFMYPEQIRSKMPDPKSDIYPFGLVLYELLDGQRPFGAEINDSTSILEKQLREAPLKITYTDPKVELVVPKALEKYRARGSKR